MYKLVRSGKMLTLLAVWAQCSLLSLNSCNQKSVQEQNGTAATDSTARADSASSANDNAMSITKTPFGTTKEGTAVDLYILSNGKGMTVKITNYGGIITSLSVPDKQGKAGDVVLGYDSLAGYLRETPYFGALVGRYGNRIAKGKFTLDGKTYTLATNNGPNHLHGGNKGFDKVVWTAEELKDSEGVGLRLNYRSKDGEEGYPGNLDVTVVYRITPDNELKINYSAQTDKATPLNLTNHSYFNLAAGQAENILSHEMMLNADRYTVVNATLIPTGELKPVQGTPFDFTTPHPIGERIAQVPGGYDHNFVLTHPAGQSALAARAYDPVSGRVMEVYTDQPGVQFYTGNFLDGSITGKGGVKYVKNYGFCLETQHFPDSPNQPSFPSTVLKPGEKYQTATTYKFSTR